jgi:hypothetical protein
MNKSSINNKKKMNFLLKEKREREKRNNKGYNDNK